MIARPKALDLLSECTGETIWPVDHCRRRGVPESWIEELADALESNFDRDRDTIYVDERRTNQFHGVRDADLVRKLATELRVDVDRIDAQSLSRSDFVRRVKAAVFEG